MNSRVMNYVLLTIIAILSFALFTTANKQKIDSKSDHFLFNFDQKDFHRLKEMVDRFNEGKGDNLMLIPPIIDGGYWIHDVMSNGREIFWAVDNTRDGMSSDRGKKEFICKAIDIIESDEYYTFELSKCNNFKEHEKLHMVSFVKDEV